MPCFGVHQVPPDRRLVYHVDTDPLTLDPARCQDYVGQLVLQALYQPLLTRNPEDGHIEPGAARYYTVTPDGLVYTFFLRESLWSDGTPVTAHDFVFALGRLVNPAVQSPAGSLLEPIRNAEQILAGELPVECLGVHAIAHDILEIVLENPVNYFDKLLASCNFSPVPRHCLPDPVAEWGSTVTNGPFVLAEYQPQNQLLLLPNARQQQKQESVAALRFWITRDLVEPLRAYEAGKVHITCNTYFPFDWLETLEGCQDLVRQPSGVLFLLQFNPVACPELADFRLRLALHHAIDRQRIAITLYGGIIAWNHFVPKGVAVDLFDGDECSLDPKLATQAWSPEIWEGAPLKLRIIFADYYPNKEILDQVRQMWECTLGIQVELEPCEFAEHTSRVAQGDYQVALILLTPMYSDPSAFLRYFLADLDEADADRLASFLISAQLGDGQSSHINFRRADMFLQERLPALPLCTGQSIYLQKPEVRGYRLFSDGAASFRGLRFAGSDEDDETGRSAR